MAKKKAPTNITEASQKAFAALSSGKFSNFALVSCFVDGEPACAIAALHMQDDGGAHIEPLFVSITPGMILTDHDGKEPTL